MERFAKLTRAQQDEKIAEVMEVICEAVAAHSGDLDLVLWSLASMTAEVASWNRKPEKTIEGVGDTMPQLLMIAQRKAAALH